MTKIENYWHQRGINPNIVPMQESGDYITYFTMIDNKRKRFQWTQRKPFVTSRKGKKTQHPAFTRVSFRCEKGQDLPLFVSPKCGYRQKTLYVCEGIPDALTLLTLNLDAVAFKSRGAIVRGQKVFETFLGAHRNYNGMIIIPDPDAWKLWTENAYFFHLPGGVRFISMQDAFESIGGSGKDVNDLWRMLWSAEGFDFLHIKEMFLISLKRGLKTILPPKIRSEKIINSPKPQKAQDNLSELIEQIEAAYTPELFRQFALKYAKKPSKGLLDMGGGEFEVRSNGGFYVIDKSWNIPDTKQGGKGIFTLASHLLFGRNSVRGQDFQQVLKTVAAFVNIGLPVKVSNRPPHPAEGL
jgi:hypothetical protein